jgi:hypothetical protein
MEDTLPEIEIANEDIPEYNGQLIEKAYLKAAENGTGTIVIDTLTLPLKAMPNGVKLIGSLRIPPGIHFGPPLRYSDGRPYTPPPEDQASGCTHGPLLSKQA